MHCDYRPDAFLLVPAKTIRYIGMLRLRKTASPAHRGRLTPLLLRCAKTVSELHLFDPLGLLFEQKRIPQFVVNIRKSRNAMEPLEATRLPWAQGVGGSNPPAPTNVFNELRCISGFTSTAL